MKLGPIVCLAFAALPPAIGEDDLGFGNGVSDLQTKYWDAKVVKDSGTLASLKPNGSDFDFLPYDLMQLGRHLENGSNHWGDITLRYRLVSEQDWTGTNSSVQRTPINPIKTGALVASDLSPTMSTGPLNITREWTDVDGDLGLEFTFENTGEHDIEMGSLGFPAAVNNIFASRSTSDVNTKCSFMDPYIGLDAGHLRVTPLSGTGPALVVTPIHTTPFEAYRYLYEVNRKETRYGTNAWEGYFEWQVHSGAWATSEWKGVDPWNSPSTAILPPGKSRKYGLRFMAVRDGIRDVDTAIRKTDTPTAISIPGYIIPRDVQGKLFLQSSSNVTSTSVHPQGTLVLIDNGNKTYDVRPNSCAWGRVRLTINYENNVTQSIHYYVTKSASKAVGDLGRFLTTKQWFDDESDPFGRGPSIMGYDGEAMAIVEQDRRIQVPGLSDEGGAGAYVAAAIKQTFQPDIEQISKLETFVDKVLFKTVQNEDYSVKRGIFFYDPELVPNYNYSSSINWKGAQGKNYTDEINRAYNYVWPAACYWALYRVGRSYTSILENHDWEWYLNQSFKTIMRGMQPDVEYNTEGLMGETIFGEVLADLIREGKTEEAQALTLEMKKRVDQWKAKEYPFGSEQAWDSTGQEGVYFWMRYFRETAMVRKAMNSVLGYMPTVPHWGYNGIARRYWDFATVTGKLTKQERQIHHYGSGLNALVMLSAFRDDPSDSYLLRVGYGGTSGPLSNIRADGFASCAMHAWPEHLFWDGFSGDYGPNFVGMTLGSGTYLVEDADVGLVVYGGVLKQHGDLVNVQVRDPVRQKIFIGLLSTEVRIDAGIIEEFTYDLQSKKFSLTLGQLEGAPKVRAAVLWVSIPSNSNATFSVKAHGSKVEEDRQGHKIYFTSERAKVQIEQA